jgi:hypothetical protein
MSFEGVHKVPPSPLYPPVCIYGFIVLVLKIYLQWSRITLRLSGTDYSSDSPPGVRIPLRVRKHFAGGAENFKSYKNKPTKGKQKGFWGYAKGINLDLGYAKGVNFDLGVCKRVQYWFGGTQGIKGWEPLD